MKKTLLTILCTVLVCSCVMGATLAYLADKTDSVTNTFTVGDIEIDLEETTGDEYKMVPGATIAKDPTVTVAAGSEACYVFVKIDKTNNVDTYISYSVDDRWEPLTGVDGVYYCKLGNVGDTLAETVIPVLTDDKVTVNTGITKAQLEAADANKPTLTFTAYAVQQQSLTLEQAWTQALTASNYS